MPFQSTVFPTSLKIIFAPPNRPLSIDAKLRQLLVVTKSSAMFSTLLATNFGGVKNNRGAAKSRFGGVIEDDGGGVV
ncbi:hypothetical protein Scep_021850 [Stephania cephalantha]|uniref:Uncharacterized protein n=1 Tax=Stephania cephalantha TaxID=152367 RepID=A0AAP0F476_9MAGN